MRCPDCGSENIDGSAYCEECGSKLFASKKGISAEVDLPENTEKPGQEKQVAEVFIDDVVLKLDREVNTIGRRSPADGIYPDVDLTDYDPDSYISRRHAHILKNGDKYYFEDLGSSNGSFINEDPIRKGTKQQLNDQDVIRLGRTEIFFRQK